MTSDRAQIVLTGPPRAWTGHLAGRARQAAREAMAGQPPLAGPLYAAVQLWLPIPGTWTEARAQAARRGLIVPSHWPEIDILVKMICRTLAGIAYADDGQIARLSVVKGYADTPDLVITLWPMAQAA